ncbi:MAG: hypothetical protein ACI8TX_000128 [Hyphomicrobiaceae bacterium]
MRNGRRHSRYVAPISNPLFNETPYITTEARVLYVHNEIPGDFLIGGGSIDLGGVELRLAVTERFGIIASKDGYADIDFANGSALPDESGFINISLGAKYAVHSDPEGIDLVNFGSTSSGTVATAAVGARFRVSKNVILGAAFEKPITSREDLMDWRAYVDVILHL